jgi:choice-of-anchor A domain-containing protein
VTSGSFNLNAGDYYVPNGTVTGGTKVASDPITFSTQFTQFQTESTEIANETATCTTCASLSGGVLTINVNTVGMNVIDLTQAQIQGANEINFQAGSGVTFASSSSSYGNAWVLLNIQGTSVTLNPNWGTDFNGSQEVGSRAYGAEDVLYNFYQATSITTTNAAIVGSVLAPWAAYTDTSGNQIDGSLVAASFTGPAEFHNLNFLGPAFTPEPAPLAGVGVGLIALALVLRRRARGDARAIPLYDVLFQAKRRLRPLD